MEISREIKFLISKYNFRPKDHLGQNFLIASQGLNVIVEVLNPQKDLSYIEIGAGFLTLTRLVSRRAKKVYAVEKDSQYLNFYKDFLEENKETNIEILLQDALDLDYGVLQTDEVYGNIPYNISSDLIVKLSKENNIKRIILLLQKEFSDRILANPKTKEYGVLTILTDLFFDKKFIRTFPESFFFPRPQVFSSLIELKRKNAYSIEIEGFISFVRKSFQMRRKKLINNIKENFPEEKIHNALKKAGLAENIRPEELSSDQYISLFNALTIH